MSQVEGVQKYGPMWKASFGPILTVHVADPALVEQVLRQEGQHPMRSDLSSWKDYRKLRGHHYGLLTSWVSLTRSLSSEPNVVLHSNKLKTKTQVAKS